MNANQKNIPPNENGTGFDQDLLGAGLPTPPKPPTEGLPLPVLYRDANLPPRNPDFVGREKLKARVREFVSRPQAGGYLILIGGMGRGYDYNVCNSAVVLTRLSVKDGRLVLSDGMSYRVLVLPDRRCMPVEILEKVKELVEAGATVVGPRPEQDPGLKNYPQCDEQVRRLASELWGECDGKTVKQRQVGAGRIVWGQPLREVLAESGVTPDFEYAGQVKNAFLDFIHRRDGESEIYFVANRLDRDEAARCTFRVSGRQPELWDPARRIRQRRRPDAAKVKGN